MKCELFFLQKKSFWAVFLRESERIRNHEKQKKLTEIVFREVLCNKVLCRNRRFTVENLSYFSGFSDKRNDGVYRLANPGAMSKNLAGIVLQKSSFEKRWYFAQTDVGGGVDDVFFNWESLRGAARVPQKGSPSSVFTKKSKIYKNAFYTMKKTFFFEKSVFHLINCNF